MTFFCFIFNRESRGLSSACSVERGTGIGPAQTFLSPETPPPPPSCASATSYRRLDDRPSRELHERIQEITVQRYETFKKKKKNSPFFFYKCFASFNLKVSKYIFFFLTQ